MKGTTTLRSPGALALGLFFTGVTGFTIFNDVWNGAAFTIAHLNAAAALVAAIAAGHMALPALWRGQVLPALGLAVIFVASTGYIVTSAGARNAEAALHKAAAILKTNEERTAQRAKVIEAEADAEKAKADYDAAKQLAARECATGKGRRCDGRIETRDSAAKDLERAESHAGMMRGRLAILGAEEQPFAGYRHAATVFAAAGLGNADAIEARLELLLPFVLVLISEVGTLVFLSLALGSGPAPRGVVLAAAPTSPKIPPSDGRLDPRRAEAPIPRRVFAGQSPTSKPAKKGAPSLRVVGGKSAKASDEKPCQRGRKRDQKVLAWVEDFRQVKGFNPRGIDVMEAFPKLPKATAYDYARTG